MEKCKFCQTELAENGTVCPNCGKDNAEVEIVTEMASEEVVPAEEITPAEETVPEEEVAPVEETAPAEEAAPAKKATPGKIALAVIAVVVLAAVLIAMVVTGMGSKTEEEPGVTAPTAAATEETVAPTIPADGNPEDVTCKGSYTVSDEEAKANRETVIATIGDNSLTVGQLQVYYWSMVNSYLSSEYGYYMMMYGAIDISRPLDTQLCAEDSSITWQQYFLKEALNYWQLCVALSEESEIQGIELSAADREYLDNLPTSLEQAAASYEMTLDELMLNNVGPGAGLEEFIHFQSQYLHGKDYYAKELAKLVPSQDQLEAFYAEHEADYAASGLTKDARYVDARHILVQVKGGTTDENGTTTYSEEDWATCEADAQAILDQWLAGDKTEESFAALATEKTEDPGSQTTGGLYENIYEGQMVEPFEKWCFDEAREYGDYGLVQTSYGYHVMYYVGSEPMWITYAENDWITEQSNLFLETLTDKYSLDVAYGDITLGFIDLGSK